MSLGPCAPVVSKASAKVLHQPWADLEDTENGELEKLGEIRLDEPKAEAAAEV